MYRWGKRPAIGLVVVLALAAGGCEWIFYETVWKWQTRAKIRVAGKDFTSEVVTVGYRTVLERRGAQYPHGRTLTFRLPDNRVVAVPARYGTYWWCADRLDGTSSGCNDQDMRNFLSRDDADGFIFDDADRPTTAKAFQFEPRSAVFRAREYFATETVNMQIEHQPIQLVSYSRAEPYFARPRDDLERTFPGYRLIWKEEMSRPHTFSEGTKIRLAAGLRSRLPTKHER